MAGSIPLMNSSVDRCCPALVLSARNMGDRTRNLVSFVPRFLAGRVAAGEALNEPFLETYRAAVLFADISGFTRLAEKMAKSGPAGIGQLTQALNVDIGCLVDVIYE